jgi:putative transposase
MILPYWQLYYHFVWSTEKREPLINSGLEPGLFEYLRWKGSELGGTVHAVGGSDDHVHIAVSIPPRLAVATYVAQLKGASSHWVSQTFGNALPFFAWQRGYGAVTFGRQALPRVIEYVIQQRERHQTGELIPEMEEIGDRKTGTANSGAQHGSNQPKLTRSGRDARITP